MIAASARAGTLVKSHQEQTMAKDETGKGNKSNAQKASDKNDDSMIKDLKERDRNADMGKVKGGATKKIK
jgi:phage-related protein